MISGHKPFSHVIPEEDIYAAPAAAGLTGENFTAEDAETAEVLVFSAPSALSAVIFWEGVP